MKDPKILDNVLISESNFGKSLLTSFIKGAYDECLIGNVISPDSTKLQDFWLQDCVCCHLKLIEELKIPTQFIMQKFKV